MKKKITFINSVSWGGVLDHTYRLTNYFKHKNKIEMIKIKSEISKQKKNSFNKSNIIILQYSGYGFSNIGAPFWLLKEINNLKKKELFNLYRFCFINIYKRQPCNNFKW